MEKILQAILNSDHEHTLKIQLVTQVCKHATFEEEARSMWNFSLEMCLHGPTDTHRESAGILVKHLRIRHSAHRNEVLCSFLQTLKNKEIDITLAKQLLLMLSTVMIDETKSVGGWGISASYSLIEWFFDLSLKYEHEWSQLDRRSIAQIWITEGLLTRVVTDEKGSRLIDATLNWIIAHPVDNSVDLMPLIAAAKALSSSESPGCSVSRQRYVQAR